MVRPFVRIHRARTKKDIGKAFAIRARVFIKEQGVPAEDELDRDDGKAIHFLARISGKAVGTARVVHQPGRAKIGRMAVLKSHRGKGVGAKLLMHAMAAAMRARARKVYLHAQIPVIGFYQSAGFRPVGPVFEEAGIPHRKMIWTKPSRTG